MSVSTVRYNAALRAVQRALAEARSDESVLRTRMRALERAEEELRKGKAKPVGKPVDPYRVAGPAVILAVGNVLANAGRTTQAVITKATGKNSGSVTYALRYLAAQDPPMAERTGRREGRSEEWVWRGGHRALAKLNTAIADRVLADDVEEVAA